MLTGTDRDWEVVELDLDDPGRGGDDPLGRLRLVPLGRHIRDGRHPDAISDRRRARGRGIVEKVGPGVQRVAEGDHVVTSFLPACGHCRWCATGQSAMCDVGALITEGCLPDLSFRFHRNGEDVGQMCMLGSLSQYSTVSEFSCVKVDDDLPLETVALVGCGVPTGLVLVGLRAGVVAGETVMVYGIGGVGANAIQGAAHAGAAYVIAVDPLANKREAAEDLGATHSAANSQEAHELAQELTRGVGADKAIITVDIVNESRRRRRPSTPIRKGGTAVITASPTRTRSPSSSPARA
jgi:S-(hydroxymethyl)glutathione dehydrogenase/alcohol dehydrogenase